MGSSYIPVPGFLKNRKAIIKIENKTDGKCFLRQNLMQGRHYGKGLIYYRLIFRLTKLAFLRAKAIPRETTF